MQLLRLILSFGCFALALACGVQAAEPAWQQALTLFGEAKYGEDFRHFDYVNPEAPKGGEMKLAYPGRFDSLNRYILKGVKAPGLAMLHDTLMTPSLDEPESYYPLLAEAFRFHKEAGWMEFRLHPQARWHDGEPVTVEDVIWTLQALKEKSHPAYRLNLQPIETAEKVGERTVRFTFTRPYNRETPLIAAGLPILPKHYYETVPFEETTLQPPLGNGPYKVADVDVGRAITYARVEDYWGRDLPVNRGRHNFARMRYDVYRDSTVALEAFKAGEYDFIREYVARNWATAYDFPAIRAGEVIKTEIPNEKPQGMQAFFFNTRQPDLSHRAVREAIALTMDFEWTNKTLFYDAYKRNESFFQYTPFAAEAVPEGEEYALLEPFRDALQEALFTTPFRLPKTDGSGQNRQNLLKAQRILEGAGFTLQEGKRINPQTGQPISVEFMLNQPTMKRVIMPMRKGLQRLGIESRIRMVEDAQYQQRLETHDYDIISSWINLGVFYPGLEQYNYWHSSQADVQGGNSLTGLQSDAADAMLERIVKADRLEVLEPAARALDRILLWEHVVVPHWHSNTYRVAWWDKFGKPQQDPPYGLALDSWWASAAEAE